MNNLENFIQSTIIQVMESTEETISEIKFSIPISDSLEGTYVENVPENLYGPRIEFVVHINSE